MHDAVAVEADAELKNRHLGISSLMLARELPAGVAASRKYLRRLSSGVEREASWRMKAPRSSRVASDSKSAPHREMHIIGAGGPA